MKKQNPTCSAPSTRRNPALSVATAAFLAACAMTASGGVSGAAAAEARIREAVAGDASCFVSNVTVHVQNGTNVTEVFFILKPGPESFIRCRVAMPEKSTWTGRMWGYGRGGWSGNDSSMVRNTRSGDAAVSCDMGTGRSTGWTRKHPPTPWPDDVWKDFGWRSTHLMTVYAKKFCKAFYGRGPDRSYFTGASTGGGQGMHEACRFPEDYDGIISELAANSRISLEASAFHRSKLAKRLKITKERVQILADAPIEFMADKDAPFARGKYLSDPRMCDGHTDAILDIAAKKDPVFAEPDVRAAIAELYEGPTHRGRRAHPGYCWGALFNKESGLFLFKNHYENKYGRKYDGEKATWDDFDDFVAERKKHLNATDPDLSAFAARGGKIIMTAGLEDQTVPYSPAIDHYEEAAKAAGGIGNLQKFFRMYLLPGCAHGSKGREFVSLPVPNLKQQIIDWVEKGIVPEHLRPVSRDGKTLDVPPYPAMAGATAEQAESRRAGIREIHPFYR